jgi:hypothetical protein
MSRRVDLPLDPKEMKQLKSGGGAFGRWNHQVKEWEYPEGEPFGKLRKWIRGPLVQLSKPKLLPVRNLQLNGAPLTLKNLYSLLPEAESDRYYETLNEKTLEKRKKKEKKEAAEEEEEEEDDEEEEQQPAPTRSTRRKTIAFGAIPLQEGFNKRMASSGSSGGNSSDSKHKQKKAKKGKLKNPSKLQCY